MDIVSFKILFIIMSFIASTSGISTFSREAMRGLKAQTDERARLERVYRCIHDIHRAAVQAASSTDATSYQWELPTRHHSQKAPFETNIPDILKGLKELFPDCTVEYKTLIRGSDGKIYDMSKMDSAVLPFIGSHPQKSHIVIDWS